MANTSAFRTLIKPLQATDPRLYDALMKLAADVERLNITVFPPTVVITGQTSIPVVVPDVSIFQYQLKATSVFLSWQPPSTTILRYEVRKGGTSWDTATSLFTTDTLSASVDPLLVGTTPFWIKAIGPDGTTRSVNALKLNVVVPPLGTPSVTSQLIDNNVLLFWTAPFSTFNISYYQLTKNGVVIGTAGGNQTFNVVFETVGGTYTYGLQAFDIAGNSSMVGSTTVTVASPPDYQLQATFTSSLTGTLSNVLLIAGPRLLCNIRNESWGHHFSDRGWVSPQDQINAGFPLYGQPSEVSGQYTEVIDYGLVINNTVISITYQTALISGLGDTVRHFISTSTDNITYTTEVEATTLFVATLRYAKIRVLFTALN